MTFLYLSYKMWYYVSLSCLNNLSSVGDFRVRTALNCNHILGSAVGRELVQIIVSLILIHFITI